MDAQYPNKLKLPAINFNCRMGKTLFRWLRLCTDSEVKSHIFTYVVLACSDFTISHGRKTGFDFVRTSSISAQFAINTICLFVGHYEKFALATDNKSLQLCVRFWRALKTLRFHCN